MGQVLQAGSSQPIGSATVRVVQTDVPLTKTTDASGAFAFSGLTDGAATTLQVSAPGYVDSTSTLTIPVSGYTVMLARQDTPSAPTLASVTVTGNAVLRIGQTSQLKATTVRSDGVMTDVTTVATWTSSSSRVATPSSSGLLAAYSAGQTTITAKFRDVSGTLSVTVSGP